MSASCDASGPFGMHSVTSPGSESFFHLPGTRAGQDVELAANHRSALPACERARYFAVKSAVDRAITFVLMVVALPLMLLISLAILLFDGWPVLYFQTRVGKNGRTFRLWKFRTMCTHAESATGAVWSSETDPRVTPLGRWLRGTHLDELPQFINILAGDMNLIGPRPERPEFVRVLAVELPCYLERLNVRPGITGLAQLHLDYDQSIADVRNKVLLDLEYIRTTTFLQDAKILLYTIPHVARKMARNWHAGRKTLNSATDAGAVASSEQGGSFVTVRRRASVPHDGDRVERHFPVAQRRAPHFGRRVHSST